VCQSIRTGTIITVSCQEEDAVKSRNSAVLAVAVGLTFVVLFVAKLNAQAPSAERQQVYQEMEATLGLVPTFMKHIPDNSLRLEWELMKQVQMAPGAIPNKYRELIGVAVSSVTKCQYCSYFHTQFAKLNGATDAELEDAIHYAKSTAGWSAYINGYQTDYDQFCKEIDQVCAHVKAAQAAQAGGK
jgi:AhpD family alkylhydroperoxidase